MKKARGRRTGARLRSLAPIPAPAAKKKTRAAPPQKRGLPVPLPPPLQAVAHPHAMHRCRFPPEEAEKTRKATKEAGIHKGML